MSPREYIPGDTVFAKLKGYPWWPARVESDKDVPAKVLKQRGKSKGVLYTVFFYGSRDYGFFGPDCVRPFDRATVERDLKAKKFKTKDLEAAIHQALDPSILKAKEEEEAAAEKELEQEEEEGEDEEEEEGETVVKPKKERKKPAATTDKKKKPAVPRRKAATVKKATETEENGEEEKGENDAQEAMSSSVAAPATAEAPHSPVPAAPAMVEAPQSPAAPAPAPAPAAPSTTATKKTKTSTKKAKTDRKKRAHLAESEPASENERKKRRKSLSTEQEEDQHAKRESSTISRKSEEPSNGHGAVGHIAKQEDLDAFKKTAEYKKIYHIRHKLQKLVYEKKPGEIQKEDFVRVSQVVKEIEDSQMTFDLLRYTKIGKVVKFACSYNYGDDEYRINQRCQQLMKNWKALVIPGTRSASAEQHEPHQS